MNILTTLSKNNDRINYTLIDYPNLFGDTGVIYASQYACYEKALEENYTVNFFDFTDASLGKINNEHYSSDGLHLNLNGYCVMGKIINDDLIKGVLKIV